MRKVSIDRFEGEYAICEDDLHRFIHIRKTDLPSGAKEGDILQINRDFEISVDKEETNKRRKEIFHLQQLLLKGKEEK